MSAISFRGVKEGQNLPKTSPQAPMPKTNLLTSLESVLQLYRARKNLYLAKMKIVILIEPAGCPVPNKWNLEDHRQIKWTDVSPGKRTTYKDRIASAFFLPNLSCKMAPPITPNNPPTLSKETMALERCNRRNMSDLSHVRML